MTPVRLGAVEYLNTWPLVRGLDRHPDRFLIRFDVPSRCAALLDEGNIDIGIIPSVEYLRSDFVAVPGVGIASTGEVMSVAVFTTRALSEVRRVALDTSSRTSVALFRVLCATRWGIAPELLTHPPDLDAMLAAADAALLIGDPALATDPAARGLVKVDLGAEWTAMTGLPFVWAVWAGREAAITDEVAAALRRARDEGVAAIDDIAREYSRGQRDLEVRAAAYLRHHIEYYLETRHQEGLKRFQALAADLGLIAAARRVRVVQNIAATTPHDD